MSIFSAILDKLGLGGKKEKPNTTHSTPKPASPAPAAPAAPAATHPEHKPAAPKPTIGSSPKPAQVASAPRPMTSPGGAATHKPADDQVKPKPTVTLPTGNIPPATVSSQVAEPEPEPMEMVDVMSLLEDKAKNLGQPSNWRTSIADLLFLLGLDHSYAARKELAVELGAPANVMEDSAKMNMWLHKTVLAQIAENGGNIPKELLDN